MYKRTGRFPNCRFERLVQLGRALVQLGHLLVQLGRGLVQLGHLLVQLGRGPVQLGDALVQVGHVHVQFECSPRHPDVVEVRFLLVAAHYLPVAAHFVPGQRQPCVETDKDNKSRTKQIQNVRET